MDITLYKNDSEPEKIDKTLDSGTLLSGSLRNESNVLTPRVLLECDAETLAELNYAYIPLFDRYYYITEIVSVRNSLCMVMLRVDVLMSFKTQIRANYAFIEKQKDAGNKYLNDGSWFHDSRQFYTVKNFPYGFNEEGEFVLITAGA